MATLPRLERKARSVPDWERSRLRAGQRQPVPMGRQTPKGVAMLNIQVFKSPFHTLMAPSMPQRRIFSVYVVKYEQTVVKR